VIQFSESVVEHAALAWLESASWRIRGGAEVAPGEPGAERHDDEQLVLAQGLRDALTRLNLARPEDAELVARPVHCIGRWWMA
jgi:type I restriction enzyme R subunit